MKKVKTRKPKIIPARANAGPQAAFQDALQELFRLLRAVDYARLPEHIRTAPKFLVARLDGLQIRMDADKNHGRGHVHIKYKKDGHAASYAIDDGSRLAGELPTYYDRTVLSWIITNQTELQTLWESAQRGKLDKAILLTFQTTVYD
jgi:hypothetical protein